MPTPMPGPKMNKIFRLVNQSSAPWGDQYFTPHGGHRVNLSGLNLPFAGSNVDMFRLGMNAAFIKAHDHRAFAASDPLGFRFGVGNQVLYWMGHFRGNPLQRNPLAVGGWFAGTLRSENNNWVFQSKTGWASQSDEVRPVLGDVAEVGINPRPTNPNATVYGNGIANALETIQDFYITPSLPADPSVQGDVHRNDANNPPWMTSRHDWLRFVGDNFNGNTFYDLSLNMEWPYPLKDIDQYDSAHLRPNFVKIQPSYNFYIKEYEEALADSKTRTPSHYRLPVSFQLPNLYTFASEMNENIRDPSNSTDSGSPFNYQITLDGHIDGVFEDVVKIVGGEEVKIGEKDTGQYFQKYGKLLRGDHPAGSLHWLIPEFPQFGNSAQHLMFSRDSLRLLDNKEGMEKQFPMSVTIEFSTDIQTGFADLLDDANLTEPLMSFVASGSQGRQFKDVATIAQAGSIMRWEAHAFEDLRFDADWAQFSFPDWVEDRSFLGTNTLPVPSPQRLELESQYQNCRVFNLQAWLDSLLTAGTIRPGHTFEETLVDPNMTGYGGGTDPMTFLDDWKAFIDSNTGDPKDHDQLWLGNIIHDLDSKTSGQPCSNVGMSPDRQQHCGATGNELALYFRLMTYIFSESAKGFIEEKLRPFENLLRNDLPGNQGGRKDAYSETLFYCIEKTDGVINDQGEFVPAVVEGLGGSVVNKQYVWLPNSSNIDVLKYIDTQVKYDTPYQYRILAYQMVIGNEYTYLWDDAATRPNYAGGFGTVTAIEDTADLWAKLCLKNKPCIKLIEIPIYDSLWDNPQGVRVLDSPPVPPDVHLIPYKGVSDKILIWFNANVGDYRAKPIEILPDDYPDDTDFDNKIRFKSDDPVSSFEIFRLEEYPGSYSDFVDANYQIARGANGVPATSFVDKIKPNKKYYYMFRSIDVHNRVSNPSAVYECELVKQEDFSFPLIRIIDMAAPRDIEVRKPFRKFLQIKVAPSHMQLNTELLDTLASPPNAPTTPELEHNWFNLGPGNRQWVRLLPQAQTVWDTTGADKKWKVRLHSKNSGKKIDFNIDFNSTPTIIDDRDE